MNLQEPSGHWILVFYRFPESEPNMEKLRSASIPHILNKESLRMNGLVHVSLFNF